ncbi:hypothetical protein C8A05DRAFT_19067 [Staphylotrichum tortipilum]|uniref:Phosphatidylinositol-specific phospholipase C X domain-containing protein n=1 Tax=Staphylotrichum tortipilum TaxID=2831512 RepID=A0AAN6MDZ7_9PEZI|nr:hypothetical protein C8A05DRAFT_19067 [Staphylotrichum longicolle]
MGLVFSRPAAAAALPAPLPTLTIRNLTITPLELKLVERVDPHPHLHLHLHKPKTLAKAPPPPPPLAASSSGEQQEVTDIALAPFSECRTPIPAPDPSSHHEQLHLTFEDPSTGHRYSASIPSTSRRSIVLTPHPPKGSSSSFSSSLSSPETKEFTAIYLPQHAFLALFSSANLSSWMSTLLPSLPLTSLSIPGTHNSPTCHVALPSVRCQVVPVPAQLANGVRFFDVRVSSPIFSPTTTTPPELALVHSVFPISLTGPKHLAPLLSHLHAFLAAHPTETLLLSLKREGTGRGTDHDLSRILHTHYITPSASKWYTSPQIPTLAACRGRIVLVRRYRLDPSIPTDQGGIDGSVWPDNVADGTCGSGTIRIQDYYGVNGGSDIHRKVRFAQEGLERAAAQTLRAVCGIHEAGGTEGGGVGAAGLPPHLPSPMPLFINFLSASNFFNASCWPDRIAVKVNPSMIEYLCMGHGSPSNGSGLEVGDAATGIVVTDWVGNHGDWDLIRCIVGWNARLQLRQ